MEVKPYMNGIRLIHTVTVDGAVYDAVVHGVVVHGAVFRSSKKPYVRIR